MVIKQLEYKYKTVSLSYYFEVYSEQLLLKNIFKLNFGSDAFAV